MEIDEIDDKMLEYRMHDEVIDALNTIASAVQENSLSPVVNVLRQQTEALSKIITSPKEDLSQKPDIIDQKLVSLLSDLNKTLASLKPKKWEFKVSRDQQGYISSITAESK